MEKVEEMRVNSNGMEIESCGRCGGSGHYSYCQMYGTTCFGCSGSGLRFTKRGAAANAFLTQIRSKPIAELSVGMEIWDDPYFSKAGWAKIVAFTPSEQSSWSVVNGEKVIVPGTYVTMETEKCTHSALRMEESKLYRVRQSAADAEITRIRAMAFQDTLSKKGEPKKVKPAKSAAKK